MTDRNEPHVDQSGQRGYALLMVLSFMAILMIGATAATVKWATAGRRETETEMAWRGNQYVRAIRLYFRKNGRYPQSITDLTDYHSGQPRFIRQAYADPINMEDGSWRLIYVMPSGQLVGSVMHRSLSLGGLAAMTGPNQNPLGGQPNSGNNLAPMGSATTSPGQTPPAPGQTPTSGGDSSQGQDQQPPTFGSGQVFGGSLIGVASKIKKPSIRIYQGGDTYFKWEFIYDPTSPTGAIQASTSPATAPAGSTGQTPPNQQPPNQQPPQTPPIDH